MSPLMLASHMCSFSVCQCTLVTVVCVIPTFGYGTLIVDLLIPGFVSSGIDMFEVELNVDREALKVQLW